MAYDAVLGAETTGSRSDRPGPELKTGAAQLLAYLAAAPLMAAALLVVAGREEATIALQFMGLYGPALITFFGGVRWGVAVMKPEGPTLRALLGAVVPLLLALPLMTGLSVTFKFAAIMVLVALLLIDDLQATQRGAGAPAWYLSVRVPLTVLIELAFIVAMVGMW